MTIDDIVAGLAQSARDGPIEPVPLEVIRVRLITWAVEVDAECARCRAEATLHFPNPPQRVV